MSSTGNGERVESHDDGGSEQQDKDRFLPLEEREGVALIEFGDSSHLRHQESLQRGPMCGRGGS